MRIRLIKPRHPICEKYKTEKSKYQEFLFLRIEYIGMTDKTSLLLLSLLDSKSTNHTDLKIHKKHAPKWKTIQLLLMWVYIRTSCCSKGTYKSAQKKQNCSAAINLPLHWKILLIWRYIKISNKMKQFLAAFNAPKNLQNC